MKENIYVDDEDKNKRFGASWFEGKNRKQLTGFKTIEEAEMHIKQSKLKSAIREIEHSLKF